MSSGSQRIALGSFVEINIFLKKQLRLISSDLSISMRLPVKTSIGCLSWTQKQKLGSHQRPPQSPSNLSLPFFLFLGSYKASSAPSIFPNVATVIIWSACTWVQNDRSKEIVSLVVLTFAQLTRKSWISGAAQVATASFSGPSVKSSSPACVPSMKNSPLGFKGSKDLLAFFKNQQRLECLPWSPRSAV